MPILITIILTSVFFDFTNGFHDSANAIATIVSTRVLTPFLAVLWAALFNFVAFFIFKEHKVAETIAGIVNPKLISFQLILSAVIAAIAWNLITWYFGIPSSSSHTLIGGLVGAAFAAGGINAINMAPVLNAVLFIVLSPVIGFILAIIVTFLVTNLTRKISYKKAEDRFKFFQLLSSAALSIAHGGGDSQKTMGVVLTAVWFSQHLQGNATALKDFAMPDWIPIICYTAIAAGTLAGGWRIVKTMGRHITKLTPLEGVCAESAGAITLFFTVILGIPVSTTHTVAGAIFGVGTARRAKGVRWNVAFRLAIAWLLTIPMSALISGLLYSFFIVLK